jgi:peptidoglycan/xylan/chitin deacetylase (PgdA/CDA1 family)
MKGGAAMRSSLRALSGPPARRRLVVFTFHRVLDRPDALLPDEPTAAFFRTQLEWIAQLLDVLPLPEAVERLSSGELPPAAACITFDDGYRNNFELAMPLLQEFNLPASFFIATGALEAGAMWNDLVIEGIRRAGERLDLRAFGLEEYFFRSDDDRRNAVNRTLDAMKYLPVDHRAEQAKEIYASCCGSSHLSLMMRPEMVRELAARGHDVGAHTMTHPILQKVDDVRARAEIFGSRDWLESVTGRRPRSFAYPNGRPGIDFGPHHCAIVGEAGFDCAVSTRWGCARSDSDPMSIPRFTPWETTRRGFFTRLTKTYLESYLPSAPDS